jgi:hypothetical protein
MAYTFKHGDRPLDDYTIQRAVGRGGFGEVYYAVSDGGREVALKYLKENPHVELRGVGHCINLKSPHLVSIFDVKKTPDGEYCIIMEYCSGPSLRDLLIAEPHGFSHEKAAFFAREIAKGLAYLHERGIVHRDLKPGNIFYDDGYVKIGDYGLSKFISVSRHSAQTASVGTVHYMAPEIGSGNYSRGVDIYALGVILYEMLCGKVPFEGSTMAEVLMKHLTSQPEIDNLPQPFGRVIRKALEKDPKDRYQTVEEMVDDLLSGEAIQQSLAGFSPNSLTAAVKQHARDRAESPVPSPNPSPRARGGFAHAVDTMRAAREAQFGGALPGKVAYKYDRISRKVEKKLAKLGGPPGGGRPSPARWNEPRTPLERKKRMVLSFILLAGLTTAVAVIFGNSAGETVGASAGMLVPLMTIGVVLGNWAARWFDVDSGPDWAAHLIRGLCSAPLLAMGCAPMFDESANSAPGLAVFLGLLVVSMFAKWDKHLYTAWLGEMSLGSAVGVGIGAIAATMFGCLPADVEPDFFVPMAGCIAASTCLIVQTLGWGPWRSDQPQARTAGHEAGQPSDDAPLPQPPAALTGRSGPPTLPAPVAAHLAPAAPRVRWAIGRAFWGLVAFALMGGAIVTFLYPLIAVPSNPHDITLAIILCCLFASMTIFAVRKTGPVKRIGFWRETLRPFLISVSLFGIGATTTGIAREWNCTYGSPEDCQQELDRWENEVTDLDVSAGQLVDVKARIREARQQIAVHAGPVHFGFEGQDWRWRGRCVGDEGRIGLVTGLILSSLVFFVLTTLTGKPPRAVAPFLNEGRGRAEPASSVKPHRGVAVLVFGILSLVTMFFPLGIAAWVMGEHDLSQMRGGRMDAEGMGMTRAGSSLGMASVILTFLFGLAVMAWAFTTLLD